MSASIETIAEKQRIIRTYKPTNQAINRIDDKVYKSFTPEQINAIKVAFDNIIEKPSPKLIDLRGTIDLIFSRFYFVLLVGKDRRKTKRDQKLTTISKLLNWTMALFLLFAINITLTLILGLTIYILKSAFGFDLLPGHLIEYLRSLM